MAAETLNTITTTIAGHFDREQDEPFKRSLAVPVDAWRSKLITNSLEKHPEQRKFFRQTIWVPMKSVQPVPCPLPMNMCPVAKSKFAIPRPLRLQGILYDYVGSIDGRNPFKEAAPGTVDYLSAGKYSKNTVFWENENQYIKIADKSKLPKIRIDGVFDRPLDVMMINCQTNNDCDYWNMDYPATGDIIQMIIQYILQIDYNRVTTPEAPEIEVNPAVPKNP
jgi:hypothetical protein